MVQIVFGGILWFLFDACCVYSGTLASATNSWKVATLLIPIPELLCSGIVLFVLHNYLCKGKSKIIEYSFAFFIFGIFIFQFCYYALSGEFVSTLAIENINQAYLIINRYHVMGFIFIICFWAIYIFFVNKYSANIILKRKYVMALLGLFLLNIFFVGWQNGYYMHKAHIDKYIVGQSPIVGMVRNFNHVFFHFGSNINTIHVVDYAFMKDRIYDDALSFSNTEFYTNRPNIIIVFTEGTSARLLGCYGGHYSDLTPNIDDFSTKSMVVDNYFNHTSATFRGTQGQLASCYPQRGGWEEKGWVSKTDNKLEDKKYQTLPNILNKVSYDTYFISPHKASDPYTKLLKMLKFENVYTLDNFSDILGREPHTDVDKSAVSDFDMYNGVIQFLQNRDSNKPFMLSFYTFGTHAFIDIPKNGVRYEENNNPSLNTLHNNDAAFGKFWEYFKNSKYSKNTIIIFTADHAHYYDKTYMSLMKDDSTYKKAFVDRIPLIIYDPIHQLPSRYNANDCTSLDLTPTVLHLLRIQNVRNSFMGHSIFDSKEINKGFHVYAAGDEFYGIYNHSIYSNNEISPEFAERYKDAKNWIMSFYKCEEENTVFK